MIDPTALDTLKQWFSDAGVSSAQLERQDKLLIVKAASDERSRLLSDSTLREGLVGQAKALGFSRVALELSDSAKA